jgi:hypothetical protein
MKTLYSTLLILLFPVILVGQSSNLNPIQKTTHLGVLQGYENQQGELIIPAKYKRAFTFEDGVAKVQATNGLYGLINIQGEEILKAEFNNIESFSTRVSIHGDTYREETAFSKTAIVKKVIHKDEKINQSYQLGAEAIRPTKEHKKAWVAGVVDKNGKFVIPLGDYTIYGRKYAYLINDEVKIKQFYHLEFKEGEKDTRFECFLNERGEALVGPIEAKLDIIDFPNKEGLTKSNFFTANHYRSMSVNGDDYKHGVAELYDAEGNILIPAEKGYQSINGLNLLPGPDYYFTVFRYVKEMHNAQRYGIVDANGNEIVKTLYEGISDYENKFEAEYMERERNQLKTPKEPKLQDLGLFRVIIEYKKDEEDVYFYVDRNGKCIERKGVGCPEVLDENFDYSGYIGLRNVKPNFKKTTSLPWKIKENNNIQASSNNLPGIVDNEVKTNATTTESLPNEANWADLTKKLHTFKYQYKSPSSNKYEMTLGLSDDLKSGVLAIADSDGGKRFIELTLKEKGKNESAYDDQILYNTGSVGFKITTSFYWIKIINPGKKKISFEGFRSLYLSLSYNKDDEPAYETELLRAY